MTCEVSKELKNEKLRSNLSALDNNGPFRDRIGSLLTTFETIVSSDRQQSAFPNLSTAQSKLIYESTKTLNLLVADIKNNYEVYKLENPFLEQNLLTSDSTTFETAYPFVAERIENGTVITPIEVYEFITNDFNFTPENANNFFTNDRVFTMVQLDSFYNKGFTVSSMGSFCSMVPNIFGAIKEFSNFFNNILSIQSKLTNVITKIQNFSAKDLLNSLKLNISKVIDKIVNLKVEQLTKLALGTMLLGPKGPQMFAMYEKGKRLKDTALKFFEKGNIDNIKGYVNGLITYATSVFENPSIEEAQFLVLRFCSLISSLENVFNGQMNPINTFIKSNNETYSILKAAGNYNTARAISAGGRRYTDQQYSDGVQAGIDRNKSDSNVYMPPPLSGEIDGVTPYNGGAGDSRLGFQGGWVSNLGEEGWTRVDLRVRIMIMRVQARLNRRLIINSGWRSKAYNDRVGGAKNSYHMRGEALDVTWSGFGSAEEKRTFVNVCKEEGFRGVGYYSGFIHVDIGPSRSWGSPP